MASTTTWSSLMLLAVLALIPLVLWALKRLQTIRPAGRGGSPMQVAAQLPLGPRERLVMLRVGNRELLLGVTPQQITLLTETEAGSQQPVASSSASAFASVLRANALRGGGAAQREPGAPQ